MYFYRVDETVCSSFQQLDLPPAAADARARVSAFLFERPLERSRVQLGAVDAEVRDAIARGRLRAVNLRHPRWRELLTVAETLAPGKKRVHLLALGDVGSHILIGLRLLGGDVISRIGICDLNDKVAARWEFEANQIAPAFALDALPPVEIVAQDALFDCDVFIFAASAGVPPVGENVGAERRISRPFLRGF